MRLGDLPRGMTRTVVQVMDGRAHVRFYCGACAWTTAFMTTPDGAVQITPEHRCTDADLQKERLKYIPEAEQRERERKVNEQEFGFATHHFPRGGTPEVM